MKMLIAAIALAFTFVMGHTGTVSAAAPAAALPGLNQAAAPAAEAVHYRKKRHYGYGYYVPPRRYYRHKPRYYGYSYRAPRYYGAYNYGGHRKYRHRHYRRW
jgi:hypothetical protein